jgi:hypothetical protein
MVTDATLTTVVEHQSAFGTMLEFLGQPLDFIRLEQTNRPIRQFLAANDDIWWACTDYTSFRSDARLRTAREKVLTSMMIQRYAKAEEEEDGKNVFLRAYSSTSSLTGFKGYLTYCATQDLPWQRGYPANEGMAFRDDTAITLAGLLEANMVDILKNSFEYAEHRTSDTEYPTVENRDIDRAAKSLLGRFDMEFKVRSGVGIRMVPFELQPFVAVDDGIVRGLAFRAGVVRLHSETFERIWGLVLKLTVLILTRTIIIASHHHGEALTLSPILPRPAMVSRASELLDLPVSKVYLNVESVADSDDEDEDEKEEEHDPEEESSSEYEPESEEEDDVLEADFEEWNTPLDDSDYDSAEDEDYEYVEEEDITLEYDTDDVGLEYDSDDSGLS